MILSKDLQEILEGVHYFLVEALQRESLSGRAECLRRGLVLQLEGLAGACPALRIQPSQPGGVVGAAGVRGPGSSTSLPYLPMNQSGTTTTPITPTTTTTTTYSSGSSSSGSSSSSGVNSSGNSSSGSSGDGFVGGGRIGGGGGSTTTTTTTLREDSGGDVEGEEIYEEFDEFTEDEGVESRPAGGGGGGGGKEEVEEKEEDGVYTETDNPVPFSTLVASCERVGPLGKKTKGLLRQVKNYLCVATGGCLYLYLKPSDDRQRKTIDLTGYIARSATGEEIKDARKRDSAFEIVCPGKKTHTFIARTARDKNDWLASLSWTISGRMRPSIPTTPAPSTDTAPTQPPVPPMPSKPAHQAPQPQAAEEYEYYHDVAEEIQEEVYEEIDGEGGEGGGWGDSFLPPPPPGLLSPSPPQPAPPHHHLHATSTTSSLLDYDPVEPEDLPSSSVAPPRPPPPVRPPLPQHLQAGDGGGAGKLVDDGEDSDDGIYCEIEDDILEVARQTAMRTAWGSDGGAGGVGTASTPPQLPQHHATTATPPPNSHVGMLSEEVFSKLSSFSPQPQHPTSHTQYPHHTPLNPSTPPKLPPKGVVSPQCDDSEYKVPMGANMEYQVPSSTPVQLDQSKGGKVAPGGGLGTLTDQLTDRLTARLAGRGETNGGGEAGGRKVNENGIGHVSGDGVKDGGAGGKDGGVGVISSPLLPQTTPKLTPQAEILPIKPSVERRTSMKDEKKVCVSSFLGRGDGGEDSPSSCPLRPSTSTSVKDMIARLNQNKPPQPTATTTATTTTTPAPATDTLTLPKQHLRSEKPAMPPRPPHLRGNSPQPPATQQKEEVEEGEEEEEMYEELDDGGGEGGERKGEWYVTKFAFVATLPQALSFGRGDEVFVYDRSGESGWWRGSLRGKSGLVPREYLRKKE